MTTAEVPEADPAPDDGAKAAPTPQARRAACIADLHAVLQKHRCRIATFVAKVDPVGDVGDLWMQRLAYDVVPMP